MEILWEILIAVAPELIPGLDTALELKDAIQAANNGNWWQSSWHFVGAALTLTPNIFRQKPGHLPELNPAIDAAGGADNLLFDVYKKIHDDGLATGMAIGEQRTRDIIVHGMNLRKMATFNKFNSFVT